MIARLDIKQCAVRARGDGHTNAVLLQVPHEAVGARHALDAAERFHQNGIHLRYEHAARHSEKQQATTRHELPRHEATKTQRARSELRTDSVLGLHGDLKHL